MTQRYASVFSGAGGLDLGLMRAGLKPGLVHEDTRVGCEVLRAALPTSLILQGDVHDLLNSGTFAAVAAQAPPLLVAGQPPLAVADRAAGTVDPESDAPQMLYRFLDVVSQAKPEAFIMLTKTFVAGPRWAAVLSRLRRVARGLGYATYAPVINAADYGVPQRREALVLIGMPQGCKPDASAAPRSASQVSAGTALRALHREVLTGKKAIRDIPCPSGVRLSASPSLRKTPYVSELLTGHGRVIDLRKPAPTLPAALGGDKTPVIDLDQLEHDAAPWIERYHDYLWRLGGTPGTYDGTLGRMRRLSLRECAALQGLPADYPLRGAPLTQFKLAGQAVPPALGQAVGRAVMAGLS